VETEVSGGAVGKKSAQGLLHCVKRQLGPGISASAKSRASMVSVPGSKAALVSSAR